MAVRYTRAEAIAMGIAIATRRKPQPSGPSVGEAMLERHLLAYELPEPEREYRFDEDRRWRFDFAWPADYVAAEVEGGTHSGGRHTRGKGFAADCEKYNAATLAGWRVYRFATEQVRSGYAIETLREALCGR